MIERSPRVNRRTLLAATLATGVLGSACGTVDRQPLRTSKPGAPTVASLVATDPFYIAHRGGGGDWPEMTAYAYAQAAKVPGLKALEVSVCISSDGVLVCSHDPTTARLTGTSYTIADETWETLSTLLVSGAETLRPSQPGQPLTRFDDVVEAYIDDFVLFVEPKVSPAVGPLMERMATLAQPDRVVWKQPINSSAFSTAKKHGFATWGYVLDEPSHVGSNLTRLARSADIDLLGAPRAGSDDFIRSVSQAATANGKPTISWAIRNPEDRARVLALGCRGLMTSNVSEVLSTPI